MDIHNHHDRWCNNYDWWRSYQRRSNDWLNHDGSNRSFSEIGAKIGATLPIMDVELLVVARNKG